MTKIQNATIEKNENELVRFAQDARASIMKNDVLEIRILGSVVKSVANGAFKKAKVLGNSRHSVV